MKTTGINRKTIHPFVNGCGTRKQGKAYLVSDISKYKDAYPFSYFVFDPPIVVENPADWGICPQGLGFIEKDGVTHVTDWIGISYYPNVADILEEAFQRFGSTLTPLSQSLERLEPGISRRLLVHPRGNVINPEVLKKNRAKLDSIPECFLPNGDMAEYHKEANNQMCATLHWQNVFPDKTQNPGKKPFTRYVGDLQYQAAQVQGDTVLQFQPAIVGWLPIDEIHLIESEDEDEMDKAIQFLKGNTDLPIFITNV